MAEGKEQKEKKKCGILRRIGLILKWIGLILLLLLLIAALIFQAPWKVITLLVIILLACTILPKPYRKWFWASVGAVVVVLVIWVFLPDDNEGWRPYTFDEEPAAIEAGRAVPDEENAAVIYDKLLKYEQKFDRLDRERGLDKKNTELWEKLSEGIPISDINELFASIPYSSFYPAFWNEELDDLTRYKPWSSKDYPQIVEWLQTHEGTIADLLEVSQKNQCRFPRPTPSKSMSKSTKRLGSMRRWAFLLIRAANNDLGDGHVDQAIEKYIAILRMAKHQYQQPEIVEQLVGIALEDLAIRQLKSFIVTRDVTEENLSTIEEKNLKVIKHDWSSDWLRMLDYEKLTGKNTVCSSTFEVNLKGKIRFNRDPMAVFRTQFSQEMPPPTYWQRKIVKAGILLKWFFVPSTPQKVAMIIDNGYERVYAMAKPEYDWQKKHRTFSISSVRLNYNYIVQLLADIAEETYYRFHDQYIQTFVEQRACQIIIALRRYKNRTGRWPESLDNIKSLAPEGIFVDPINNDTFVYKLTEKNFTLYSKGKNSIDDGGKGYRWDDKEEGADDIVIWPPR